MRATLDNDMIAGDARELVFTINDRPIQEGGQPVNLAGMTAKYAFAPAPGATPTFSKTSGSGVTITDFARGIVTVYLAPSDTASLLTGNPKLAKRFYHELVLIDDLGPHTVHEGWLLLKPKTAV